MCVLACGQLLRVLFSTQNMQERSSLLGKVSHIEHSCHSNERIYEYCSEKWHTFCFVSLLLQGSILRKYLVETSGNLIITGEWQPCVVLLTDAVQRMQACHGVARLPSVCVAAVPRLLVWVRSSLWWTLFPVEEHRLEAGEAGGEEARRTCSVCGKRSRCHDSRLWEDAKWKGETTLCVIPTHFKKWSSSVSHKFFRWPKLQNYC